ncbi:Putative mycotoxin biosynthesis protein UstYa [Colletotrichum destructivum]|uniref:Mycotoxin biosynthesis protein UstYa n=1 Tax=Colletotrichum destructivum TaxID=34406 RepID=A0AAX4IHV6_9PEZI|nr:Putative mycotoxin biosynthesis protein UstYa [Colletotrichum destructivum]
MAEVTTEESRIPFLTTGREEKERLLEMSADSSEPPRSRKRRSVTPICITMSLLVLSNFCFCVALILTARANLTPAPPSWMPPERYTKQTFQFQKVFGEEPSERSEAAWTRLIPMGKGWINVTTEDELPYMPGLDKSIPEKKALLSVFHQLHCLYMTRSGFFNVRDGHLDKVNTTHLSHCWDYLRQSVMCAGDTTLEWKPANDIGSTGWGYRHTCKDYTSLFIFAEQHRSTDKKEIHSK